MTETLFKYVAPSSGESPLRLGAMKYHSFREVSRSGLDAEEETSQFFFDPGRDAFWPIFTVKR